DGYYSETFLSDYVARFAPFDPWVRGAVALGLVNRISTGERCTPTREYERGVFYNEFLRSYGDDTYYCIGGVFTSAGGEGRIGIHRGRSQAAFTDEDARRMECRGDDLRRLLAVRGELASVRRAARISSEAWDVVGLASIVVRGDGFIVQLNAAAETVLRREVGLSAKGGLLRAGGLHLATAVAAATASREPIGATVAVAAGPSASPFLVTVMPLRGHSGPALALVLFADPLSPDTSVAPRLRSLFGLTAHEAAVAAEIAQGFSLERIARARGITVNTVKAQLKTLSSKMDCHRQSEVTAKVRDLAPIAGS
ncbi:MAG: helix-turn-helix transcriptional regulator, partial [Caulobacteraceae bacterium]